MSIIQPNTSGPTDRDRIVQDPRSVKIPGPGELADNPGEMIRRLFSPRQFQQGVDKAFKQIFGVENKRGDGRAFVMGICPENPDPTSFIYTYPDDHERIFRGVADEAKVRQWYENIRGRFPPKLRRMKVGDRRSIFEAERTLDEITEIIRGESESAFGHEVQHLTWGVLRPIQKRAVIDAVKTRLPDYNDRRKKIRQNYQEPGTVLLGPVLDDLTCDEILAETRRLTQMQVTYSMAGYFKSGVEGFMELAPVIPIMDAVTRNYAEYVGIPSPKGAFEIIDSSNKLRGLRQHDNQRGFSLFKVEQQEPFTLPRSIRVLKDEL